MYAGTGNISREVIIEQLMNISREVDTLAVNVYNVFPEQGLPELEVLDKLFRQDITMAKTKVEETIGKLLMYIASGRLELVDSKEIILSITSGYETIVQRMEAFIYRLVMVKKAGAEDIPEASESIRRLVKLLIEVTDHLTAMARLVSNAAGNAETARLIESRADKVFQAEKTADDIYREALDSLLHKSSDFKQYILYRDALDLAEDAIDAAARVALYYKIMGLSLAYGA